VSPRFDLATAVEPRGGDEFEARLDRAFWITHGPNGGYLAALLLRAFGAALGDPARAPRSLTVHYTEPGREGPARIATRVERSGRSLSTLSARMEQEGRTIALALAAFASSRESAAWRDLRMPEVPAPESLTTRSPDLHPIPHRAHWETRPVPDGPGVGGWIRPAVPFPLDACALAALCDAWPPAVYARADLERRGVPTVDLTVHFREPLVAPAPDTWYLGVFRTQTAAEGFVEEDGEIWTRDGRLLAQSRQLALLR
jgi:acyl-CoA thioesterase